MLWVLVRNTPLKNGRTAYVAYAGGPKSYTQEINNARVFQSKEAAKSEACGNETPVLKLSCHVR